MRILPHWIEAYLEYHENTEPAEIFHKWSAMSVIAASLRKKVCLNIGRIRIYPNMYVVFVGPPGGPRKSQAITYGINFLRNIPDVVISADVVTPQALIQDLEASALDEALPDGTKLQHASLTVTSKELESFLGQKIENAKMTVMLTDLFDASEIPWKYRTKHYGTNVIPSVFLNIIAASTPDSIANSITLAAIGGGLTSRIMFIWAERKRKKVTYLFETERERELKEQLQRDLYIISRMAGTYEYSPDANIYWDDWYQEYEAQDSKRICKDNLFNGWYERKPLYLQKLSTIVAAAQSSIYIIEIAHVQEAMAFMEEAEKEMSNVFRSIGRSLVVKEVELVTNIVRGKKWIKESQLMSMTWRDIDSLKFDNVMATVTRKGLAKRSFVGPKGEKGSIWYCYTGKDF